MEGRRQEKNAKGISGFAAGTGAAQMHPLSLAP